MEDLYYFQKFLVDFYNMLIKIIKLKIINDKITKIIKQNNLKNFIENIYYESDNNNTSNVIS